MIVTVLSMAGLLALGIAIVWTALGSPRVGGTSGLIGSACFLAVLLVVLASGDNAPGPIVGALVMSLLCTTTTLIAGRQWRA